MKADRPPIVPLRLLAELKDMQADSASTVAVAVSVRLAVLLLLLEGEGCCCGFVEERGENKTSRLSWIGAQQQVILKHTSAFFLRALCVVDV